MFTAFQLSAKGFRGDRNVETKDVSGGDKTSSSGGVAGGSPGCHYQRTSKGFESGGSEALRLVACEDKNVLWTQIERTRITLYI